MKMSQVSKEFYYRVHCEGKMKLKFPHKMQHKDLSEWVTYYAHYNRPSEEVANNFEYENMIKPL